MGFEKVIAMIDELVANLKKEQKDDDAKKVYCDEEFDKSDDKKKVLENSIADSETAIAEMQGAIATLTDEIAALEADIKALDKAVADARELSAEESVTVSMGGTLAPTPAPGGIGNTGIGAFAQVAPPPPPETFGPYTKKGESSTGVIAMIDLLVADLDKEMQEADVMEKDSQREYEEMMANSATKRAD